MLYAICYLTHNSLPSGDMLKKRFWGIHFHVTRKTVDFISGKSIVGKF